MHMSWVPDALFVHLYEMRKQSSTGFCPRQIARMIRVTWYASDGDKNTYISVVLLTSILSRIMQLTDGYGWVDR
jgi:hypothetical protein